MHFFFNTLPITGQAHDLAHQAVWPQQAQGLAQQAQQAHQAQLGGHCRLDTHKRIGFW